MSRDFTIRAVSRSYLTSTGRPEDELISVDVFEAFPENPALPAGESTKDFIDSFERVLRTRRPHQVNPLRYDVQDPACPGAFIDKRWVLVNAPILDGTDLLGVMVRVEDVTMADAGLVRALRAHQDALTEADMLGPSARSVGEATSFLAVMESYGDLASEVINLRHALRTRPTIEQAKGIIMADRRCSSDQAFEVLKRLSMDTNVRVADVAAAIVYQLRSR